VKKSRCEELMYALHIEADGKRFFEEVCALDLEGVIAKRKNGIYREGRTDWLKIKNPKYSQAEGRRELLRG
jgi:ATP-dependent DNA ligase